MNLQTMNIIDMELISKQSLLDSPKMNRVSFWISWKYLFVIKETIKNKTKQVSPEKKFLGFFFELTFLPEYIKSLKQTTKATNFGWENCRCLYIDLPSHMTATKLDTPVQTLTKVAPIRPLVLLMQVPFTIILPPIYAQYISNLSVYISDIFTLRWIMISISDCNQLQTRDNL